MPATRSHVSPRIQHEFPCKYRDCGKTFSRSYDLQRHERIHCDYDSRRFGCKVEGCNFRANQLAGLKVHENSIHKGIRLPCDFPGCDRTFSDPSSRSKHRQRFHNQGPEGEQSGEGESEESAPRLEEVAQDVPRYSPEAALPPVPRYWPIPSRSGTHGSHGVAVPARVVRHVEEHSGDGAPDVLSQFAAFALREAGAIPSGAHHPNNNDSDAESVSTASSTSRRSQRASSYRRISRSASSRGASSVASSSAVPSSAVSPAPTSAPSLPTPTHMPSPPSELSGVLNSAFNVATDVNIAQPTQMDPFVYPNLNLNVYAAPQIQIHAEPNYSQRRMSAMTIDQYARLQQQYTPQSDGLSVSDETYDLAHFHPSTIGQHRYQSQPQYQQMPSVTQDVWAQPDDRLRIDSMNFDYSTMSYDLNDGPELHPTESQGSAVSALTYDTDTNFWPNVNVNDPHAFDMLAVQALDIGGALEDVQPRTLTPGVHMGFPAMLASHSRGVVDPRVMQGSYQYAWSNGGNSGWSV